ncbi:hypothetical protein, partial [Vibrio parahaemolyticus]
TVDAINPDGSGPQGQLGVVAHVEITTRATSNLNVGDDLLLTVTLSDAFGNTLEGIDPRNIDLGNHNANLVG